MTLTCENCGQKVLETDTRCWHCGKPLPKRALPKPAPLKTTKAAKESQLSSLSLTALGVYVGVTAVTLLLFVFVTNALGQKPLIVVNGDTAVQRRWAAFTDEAFRFTLDLPPNWQVYEGAHLAEGLAFLPPTAVGEALAPLVNRAEEAELSAVVLTPITEDGGLPGFILIAQTPSLDNLPLEAILQNVKTVEYGAEITHAQMAEVIFAEDRPSWQVHMVGAPLTCQQVVVRPFTSTTFLAACASTGQYVLYRDELTAVLSSFQLLLKP